MQNLVTHTGPQVKGGYEDDTYASSLSSVNDLRGKEKVIETGNNKRSKQVTGFFQPPTTADPQKSIKFALGTKAMVDAADMVET